MARKFNVGRQGEQLLNEEWHQLFMSLKYLNYDRYKQIDDVQPERQTNIPNHAIRLQMEDNVDLLKTFYPTSGTNGEWRPIFENYYHPMNSSKPPEDQMDIVPYRICVDPKSGTIQYWDPANKSWQIAFAHNYEYGELDFFNGLDFQFISDLKEIDIKNSMNEVMQSYYPVPYVNYGRLFSEQDINYIESKGELARGRYVNVSDYSPINGCAIYEVDKKHKKLSWVHVNASKLMSIDKRLIKTPTNGFINITSTQTEFYGFKADKNHTTGASRLGTLLLKDTNYTDVMGGIQLTKETMSLYNYIYSLTYNFDNFPSNEGYVIINTTPVTGDSEVFIGNYVEAPVALFLDGLSLEQTDEFGDEIYRHNQNEGVITFVDDEDAEIINNMQMAVLAFPHKSDEFILDYNGSNISINEDSVSVRVYVDVDDPNDDGDIPGYRRPMVFCSGLGLQETEIFEDFTIDDVNIEGDRAAVDITIKGLVIPSENEPIKGFIADVGKSFVSKGQVYDCRTQYNAEIKEDKDYVVFVSGLLLTPTNGDMTVTNGYIELMESEDVNANFLEYVVLEIDQDDDNKVGLVFDETVSYFSTRIDDNGEKAVYNDCSTAVVYIENGIIIDQATIEKPLNALEGYYKGNQIIKVPMNDNNSSYKYYIYDYTLDEPQEITDRDEINIIEHLIGYYSTTGSIHLLKSNLDAGSDWTNCALSYYAYSYANMIDEPMTYGKKSDLPIPAVANKKQSHKYNGSASRMNAWNGNCASLSTYINGLIIDNVEVDEDGDNLIRHYDLEYPKFYVPTDTNYYGTGVDIIAVLKNMYNQYKAIKDKKESDYVANAGVSISFTFERVMEDQDLLNWKVGKRLVSSYFKTERLAQEALKLAIYINVDMQNESTSYVIERLEKNEFMSAYRDFIYLETDNDNDHGQIYKPINDTIETDFVMAPGTVHVYHNGVLLAPEDYCKFDNNKVMFNVDVCGLQQLPDMEIKMRSIPEHVSDELKQELEVLLQRKQVIRIIEDTAYYIPTSARDTILIEKRPDTSIKTATYEILTSSYGTQEFTRDYYDIPISLLNTGDYVKIYINGVRYEGEYTFTNSGGIRGIKLLESNALVMDPLYTHLISHAKDLEKYKSTYNKDYKRQVDKITFEWR